MAFNRWLHGSRRAATGSTSRPASGHENEGPAVRRGLNSWLLAGRAAYLMAILRGFDWSDFGSVTVKTPSLKLASTLSVWTLAGRVNERVNVP